MDLAVIALTFVAIFVVELPDKTFIADPGAVHAVPPARWSGSASAWRSRVQTLVAVAARPRRDAACPTDLVKRVALAIFLVGAVLLFREAPGADARGAARTRRSSPPRPTDADRLARPSSRRSWCSSPPSGATCRQLLTISLVAKYDDPVSVFIGALGALLRSAGWPSSPAGCCCATSRCTSLHYVGAGGLPAAGRGSRRTSSLA